MKRTIQCLLTLTLAIVVACGFHTELALAMDTSGLTDAQIKDVGKYFVPYIPTSRDFEEFWNKEEKHMLSTHEPGASYFNTDDRPTVMGYITGTLSTPGAIEAAGGMLKYYLNWGKDIGFKANNTPTKGVQVVVDVTRLPNYNEDWKSQINKARLASAYPT